MGSVLIILLERVVVGECPVAGDSRCEHLGGQESWCYVLVDGASCIGQGLLVVVRRKAIRYALSSIKSVPSVTRNPASRGANLAQRVRAWGSHLHQLEQISLQHERLGGA